MQRFDDAPGAERRGRRGLQHDGVAADQRGSELPRWNGAGKIPGRDQADYADGFANGEHVDAVALGRDDMAGHARAFTGEIAKDVDGAAHFALGLGQCFAFFARHFGGDGIEAAVEEVGGFVQYVAARGTRGGGPGGKGSRSGISGAGDVLSRAFREQSDDLAGVGGVAIFECLGAIEPFTVDVVGKCGSGHKWESRSYRTWNCVGGAECPQVSANGACPCATGALIPRYHQNATFGAVRAPGSVLK